LTEHATNVASAATSTATAAVSNVGDSIFLMFGGGAKKERKEEDEDRGDVSGSAKAQKEAAAEENPEVRLRYIHTLKKC
jgi:Ran-binding protein 1